MPTTADDVLAEKLRKCYQFERNRYQHTCGQTTPYRLPRYWNASPAGDPEAAKVTVWHRLARLCRQHEVDPVRYVQWRLSMDQLLLAPAPEPNQLLTATNLAAYRAGQVTESNIIRARLKKDSETGRAYFVLMRTHGGCKPLDAWEHILTNDTINLTPLYRYGIAANLRGRRFARIARNYLARALLQYQRYPDAYDRHWSILLPPRAILEQAARCYEEIINQEP